MKGLQLRVAGALRGDALVYPCAWALHRRLGSATIFTVLGPTTFMDVCIWSHRISSCLLKLDGCNCQRRFCSSCIPDIVFQ
ncbi:hypothetical protein GDO81_020887 [Engystomops pustulosus]|uniref:Secreted protein n=1 Tax=Engystomops pustulosus TaxID=76066 RepID=A0AAV6YWF1_ENGPU|nr:hypothetical protein GDO81_020887 [Engystomops pustulosus]